MTPRVSDGAADPEPGVERSIASVLLGGTLAGIAMLAVGVGLMAVDDVSPTVVAFPPFEPSTIPAGLVALDPAAWLWAGIVVLIATPIARVVGELVAFATRRDRVMALVAAGILAVVALSVAVALAAGVA